MVNEGSVIGTTAARVRSAMVAQLHRLGRATPVQWEGAVFEALTGHTRDEVDWDVEDNQAGYFTWLKAFDQLVGELVDDGHVTGTERDGSRRLKLAESEPAIGFDRAMRPNT